MINDLYLKYEYHNYLTGKLSDFAGLFAFAYFFSCFFPKKVKSIYALSGFLFVFWKSEFSQPIFDFAHSYGIGIDRTIDYSDLIALFILPISYNYWKTDYRQIIRPIKILKPIIISVCCLAFVATSLPQKNEKYNYKSNLETSLQTDIYNAKDKLYIYQSEQENRYIYSIQMPDRKASIETKIELKELENGYLKIKLDSILNYRIEGTGIIFSSRYNKEDVEYLDGLQKTEIEKLFIEQINEQLGEK